MNPTSPTVRSDSSTHDVSVLGRLGIPIYLPSACMALGQMVLLVVLPLFIVSRGGGPSLAALVFAMRGLGSVLANVPVGFAIARWGQKSLMLVGSGVMGCSALLIMATDSTWLIAFATLMFGAGMGTWLLARLAYITETVPRSQRGTALSGLAGLQRLGMLLGPVIAGLGIASVGYHVVFAAVSVSAWVTVLLIWLFVPNPERDDEARPSQGTPPVAEAGWVDEIRAVSGLLARHRKVFLSAGSFIFCLQMLREQRRLLVVLWGTHLGLEADVIGVIVSASSLVDMGMFPVAGYVMDRWGRKVAGLACIFGLGGAMGLLPLTTTALSYLLVATMAGVGNGLGSGIILTMGSDLAPREASSQFLGVWRLLGDMGALSGPLLVSVVASLVVALGLSAVMGVAGGLVLWCCVDETLKRSPDPPGAADGVSP